MNLNKKTIAIEFRHIPTLTGEEGRRFIYNAEHPKRLPKKERERIMNVYKKANEIRDGVKSIR